MSKWQDQACESLELACAAISNGELRQAIILLDDACGLTAQAYLRERGEYSKLKHGDKSPPIPVFLRAMINKADPPLSKTRLNLLLELHEVRGILVHRVSKELKVTRQQCMVYLRETLAFAGDYGVPQPKLIPSDLPEIQPLEILIEFGSEWDPRDRPLHHRKHIREAIERRGMLAGVVANANWPLVRCSLCRRLVPVDHLVTPQDEFMTEDNEPVRVYCLYGCSDVHQTAVKEDEKEAGFFDAGEYYLQPVLELISRTIPFDIHIPY